jgi:radical SAM protein with 4Fe4S-binding SPASM domain
VVVWNTTRQCNLRCRHCYAAATARPDPLELTTDEGFALIDELARTGVASLVLSGGEPLLRADLGRLAHRAAEAGLHVALSTGGTLLDAATARELRAAGVQYVGVSIDGLRARHDQVRGLPGGFGLALSGLRRAREAGLRVGLRFTLTRTTLPDLERVLDLMEDERVDRGYVSHLVHVGRARRLSGEAVAPRESRRAVETIFARAEAWRRRGFPGELVTGNNDADGVAFYLWMRRRCQAAAGRIRRQLALRGGNATGVAIASVDSRGEVHPDQFWAHATLGNVRARSFGAIWTDTAEPLLAALRARRRPVGGRCGECDYLDLCGGGNRARAEALTGDRWAPDPGCHLTDAEIGAGHGRMPDETLDAAPGGGADDLAPRECAPAGPE